MLLCSVRAALGPFCIARRFFFFACLDDHPISLALLNERTTYVSLDVLGLFGYMAPHVFGTFDERNDLGFVYLDRDRYPFTYIYDSIFLQN